MLAGMNGQSSFKVMSEQVDREQPFTVTVLVDKSQRMVRSQRYKYIHCKDDPMERLFDRQEDPGETENLAVNSAYASELTEHRRLLREWERRLDPSKDIPHVEYWRNI